MPYRIDAELKPSTAELPGREHGPRSIAVVEDERGIRAEFVVTELLVHSKKELEAVVQLTGGMVIATDEVPAPPPGLEQTRDIDPSPRMWVVHVDPSRFSLDRFDTDSRLLGAHGESRVSSEAGARLLAMVAWLKQQGRAVGLNFIMPPTALPITSSTEGFGVDAFSLPEYQATGSKSCVTQAWQFFQAYQSLRPTGRVRVAIIDGGFWLDPTGAPLSREGGKSDLPPKPIQYDFIDKDYTAGGMNNVSNSQGQAAPWHGNGSASVATGVLNNGAGAAGTGGLIADPILFKIDMTLSQIAQAVRTATAWGADVVNLSLGGPTNWWWRTFASASFKYAFEEAKIRGVIIVAAAGNDSQDVDDNDVYPCTVIPDIICVGAIDKGANAMGYSNYGGSVDIWAPTNISAMPDGNSANPVHSGTSAAAPFVAGVAAMLRAIDRNLDSRGLSNVLTRTAWRDSKDAKVSAYVNAYAAVLDVAGNRLPPDRFEQNSDRSTATELQLASGAGTWETLAISDRNDRDWYYFSIDDFSSIDIDVDFVNTLANLDLALSADDTGSMGSEGESTISRAVGRRYHADLLAPGKYSLVVNGNGPNVYDLKITTGAAVLSPDQFEPNDTLATAASLPAKPLGHWMKQANFHTNADVDFYRLDGVRLAGPVAFDFSIAGSDVDLVLSLFDQTGTEVKVVGPARFPELKITSGATIVKVESGGRRGRYIFSYGYRITDAHILDGLGNKRPLFYDPGDPGPRWLVGPEEYLVFTAHEKLSSGPRRLELITGNKELHLSLVTATGEVIAEGTRDRRSRAGEEVSLGGLHPGQQYAIRVSAGSIDLEARLPQLGGNKYELRLL